MPRRTQLRLTDSDTATRASEPLARYFSGEGFKLISLKPSNEFSLRWQTCGRPCLPANIMPMSLRGRLLWMMSTLSKSMALSATPTAWALSLFQISQRFTNEIGFFQAVLDMVVRKAPWPVTTLPAPMAASRSFRSDPCAVQTVQRTPCSATRQPTSSTRQSVAPPVVGMSAMNTT